MLGVAEFWCRGILVSQNFGVNYRNCLRLTTNSVLEVGYLFVATYATPQTYGTADQNMTMAIVILAPAFYSCLRPRISVSIAQSSSSVV
jgi:hypothetical protein